MSEKNLCNLDFSQGKSEHLLALGERLAAEIAYKEAELERVVNELGSRGNLAFMGEIIDFEEYTNGEELVSD